MEQRNKTPKRQYAPRQRVQRGFVREESSQWRGYYNVKIVDADTGAIKYKQRSVLLGHIGKAKSASKIKAQNALYAEIQRVTAGGIGARPDGSIALQKFIEERWLPMREAKWRPSSKASAMHTLSHIYAKFGAVPLEQLDKVALQSWVNGLAATHSKSLTLHVMFYLKSILAEAVDQDYLPKNPAHKLEAPRTKKVAKDTLTPEEFRAVLAELTEPYNLIVQIAVACAFRPSELLALRWRDLDAKARTFTIQETVYRGEIRPFTKTTEEGETDKTLLTVAVPDALVEALLRYRDDSPDWKRLNGTADEYLFYKKFIFQSSSEKADNFLNKENILFRVFRPVAEKLGLAALNFQTLRRTAATLAQSKGSVKDVQSMLRHRTADISANEYMQVVPESARNMVNSVYEELHAKGAEGES
jgi:integrase